MDLDVFKKPNVSFAFLETESVWGLQERLFEIVKPRAQLFKALLA